MTPGFEQDTLAEMRLRVNSLMQAVAVHPEMFDAAAIPALQRAARELGELGLTIATLYVNSERRRTSLEQLVKQLELQNGLLQAALEGRIKVAGDNGATPPGGGTDA